MYEPIDLARAALLAAEAQQPASAPTPLFTEIG
jgi:hypothetical protein